MVWYALLATLYKFLNPRVVVESNEEHDNNGGNLGITESLVCSMDCLATSTIVSLSSVIQRANDALSQVISCFEGMKTLLHSPKFMLKS